MTSAATTNAAKPNAAAEPPTPIPNGSSILGSPAGVCTTVAAGDAADAGGADGGGAGATGALACVNRATGRSTSGWRRIAGCRVGAATAVLRVGGRSTAASAGRSTAGAARREVGAAATAVGAGAWPRDAGGTVACSGAAATGCGARGAAGRCGGAGAGVLASIWVSDASTCTVTVRCTGRMSTLAETVGSTSRLARSPGSEPVSTAAAALAGAVVAATVAPDGPAVAEVERGGLVTDAETAASSGGDGTLALVDTLTGPTRTDSDSPA